MPKIWSNKHIFQYSWESVTNVWWQKYPNPHSLQVDTVDTIDRHIDKKTGALVTKRLITASLNPPSWMAAIGFPNWCYVIEEVTCDPKSKTLTLRSKNLTGNQFLEISELCTYSPDPKNPTQTIYNQAAHIKSPVPLVSSNIEHYSLGIHSGNAFRGLSAMEEMCDKWKKIGLEGYQKVLNYRLDTINTINKMIELQKKMISKNITVPKLHLSDFPNVQCLL